jgi:predicted transcriptional regulator
MPWRFLFDPYQPRLRKVLKDYEELALRHFWDEKAEDAGSKDVWNYVSEKMGEGRTISKASVIQFLKAMGKEGVLESRRVRGRGGYHFKYTANMDENRFTRNIARTIIDSLMRDFPQETLEALREIIST